jgi:hypothetical protein
MEEYVYRTWMPPIPDERNRYFSVIQGPQLQNGQKW